MHSKKIISLTVQYKSLAAESPLVIDSTAFFKLGIVIVIHTKLVLEGDFYRRGFF